MIRVADKLYYPSVLQRCQVKVLPGKDRNGTMTPDGGRRRIRENRLLLAVRGRPLKKKYHHGRIDSDLADKPLHSGGIRKPLDGKSAIHMASAWATDIRLVLGQLKTDKSNEINAIPELIKPSPWKFRGRPLEYWLTLVHDSLCQEKPVNRCH